MCMFDWTVESFAGEQLLAERVERRTPNPSAPKAHAQNTSKVSLACNGLLMNHQHYFAEVLSLQQQFERVAGFLQRKHMPHHRPQPACGDPD